MEAELRQIMGCTCLRMRRAARLVTQAYDHAIEPTGLTANQFGVLACLYGAASLRLVPSIGGIAEYLGMDPSTLNRNLKPLAAKGLVRNLPDPADARVRIVQITDSGERIVRKALPRWRGAQAQIEKALGPQATATLNDLLDVAAARLGCGGVSILLGNGETDKKPG